MFPQKTLIIFVALAFLFTACALGSSPSQEAMESEMPAAAPQEQYYEVTEDMLQGEAMAAFEAAGEVPRSAAAQVDQPRLIIRTGDMSIVVTDTEEAMTTIAGMAESAGGWVVNSSVYQFNDDAMSGDMTIRIPAEGFDSILEQIQSLAVEVTRVSTSGQDVTEEYVDLSARLANLEATADRVRDFLDEARNVEEALAVNQELSRLEGEIEALKGRLQYLEQSAAFSTLSINLTPDVLAQPLQVAGWQPQGVARSAVEALVSALQTLVDAGIWLVIFVLPIVLLIAIPIWLLIRFLRRRRQSRSSVTATGE